MQVNIKHEVVAITLDRDLQARKGDIIVVSSDGTGQPAVLPGLSFEVKETERAKPKLLQKSPPTSFDTAQPTTTHVRKNRLHVDNVRVTDREYRYLELFARYEEPLTTKEIALFLDESYASHGAVQTNILRPMVTARMVRRMHVENDHQRNGVYGYQITQKGKKVLRENSQKTLKEVA